MRKPDCCFWVNLCRQSYFLGWFAVTEALLRFKSGDEMVQGGVSDISSLSSSFLSGDFFLADL